MHFSLIYKSTAIFKNMHTSKLFYTTFVLLLTVNSIFMKAKITFVLLFTFATYAASAQFPKYYFGLKAAPQISWMKPNADSYSSNGAKLGFGWGFIAEFNFTENHSIATGFNMLFNGGKLQFPTTQGSISGTMNRNYFLKYLELPFSLKMRTNPINGFKYFGRVGLGTASRIGSKTIDEFVPISGATVTTAKANYSKISFARESLIVGLGTEYTINDGPKLGVEFAFNNGFTNILKEQGEKAVPNFFELAVSVLF